MTQPDTRERILNAAGALFAERGYAETSLRTVTGAANVNLAAVNYHFGSKKGLIQAVFARFMDPFCVQLMQQLDELESSAHSPSVEQLLHAIYGSLSSSSKHSEHSLSQIMRLIGQAYTQSQEHLRQFVMERYQRQYQRFHSLLLQAMPDIKPEVFYWRVYFALGASVFTLSSFDSISAILKSDYHSDSNIDEVLELLIPASAALLKN